MSVVSFEFLGFLAALAVVYYVLPMRVRKWALLAGSAAFWLLCGWQGAAYLTAETLLIWGCARLMGRFSERRGVCRALLVGGMVTVFGAMVLMKALAQLQALPDGLLVPIGLSYFTFQSIGYLIDVYRGKVTPEKNYAKVLLFAGFFPQMTQGPITTWKQLMPQLDSPHRLSPNGFVSGVFLMAWGFFKKLVIADRLMPAVSVLVATAQELPGWLVLATAAMYAIVLYADFSGGIDIIRGAAERWASTCRRTSADHSLLQALRITGGAGTSASAYGSAPICCTRWWRAALESGWRRSASGCSAQRQGARCRARRRRWWFFCSSASGTDFIGTRCCTACGSDC